MRPILITFSSVSKLPFSNSFSHAKTEFHLQYSGRKSFADWGEGEGGHLSLFFLLSFSRWAFFSVLFWYEKCVRKFNRSYCTAPWSSHCCNAKFFDSCGACRYATCNVCNVQHACDEPSLLRPHGVCVIIFPTAPSEFCIISIYKLFQRVGKSCTNKGRKNPTRSIKKKKPSPSQAPQTENLISQLISIWNNLELQQIRSRAEGGKQLEKLKTQSEPQSEPEPKVL